MRGKIVKLERAHRAFTFTMVFALLLIALPQPRVLAQSSLNAGNDNPIVQKYRQLIPQLMTEQDIPGLAVAVVDDARILWAEGFGFTDNDHNIPITPDSILSATFSAHASAAPDDTPTNKPSRFPSRRVYS